MKQKITSYFVCLLLASLFVNFIIDSNKIAASNSFNNGNIRTTDEILVKFKGFDEISAIKIADHNDFNYILQSYNNLAGVEYAEPNYIYQASIIPSDTNYNNQWYLQKIKATEAWDDIRESPKVIIAILDSGVQVNHPDIKSNIWRNKNEIADNNIDDDKNGFIDDFNGWDFVNNVPDPSPKFQEGYTESGILHGTIIAGVAAASGNNATGIAGITWKAQIMPLKVLNDKGEGNTNKVIKAIDYAIANSADIINLSFVGFGYSKGLDDAVKRAYDAGILIVAAGGNEQDQGDGYYLDQTPMYPICLDGPNDENRVIGVAATDALDQKAPFSSYGFKCIDIAAPGISIYSTVVYSANNSLNNKFFNKYYDGFWSGTSVAVPMVSGALALIEAANPSLNRNQVANILYQSADNINRLNPNYLNKLGRGRINVKQAVSQALLPLINISTKIIAAPFTDHQGIVKITDKDGKVDKEFTPYDNKFLGGVNLASGDVNGDKNMEIITAAGSGGGPHIKIYNLKNELVSQFFAYSPNFRGGVNIASADVDGDGLDEIITGPGSGEEPLVKIFDYKTKLKNSFLAYDKNFKGGVYVAAGDVNGDGIEEIITGTGYSGGPQVKIFKPNGIMIKQFFAYTASFRGGVRVAVGDINGGVRANKKEIITAPGKGGGPHIKIFDDKGMLLSQFFAFNANLKGGVNVAAGDLDNDGLAEIVAGAGPSGAPHIRVFKPNSTIVGSFYAYEEAFTGGVNVGVIEISN